MANTQTHLQQIMSYNKVPLKHNNPLEPVFVYLLCTHVCLRPLTYTPPPSIYPVPWPAQPRGHLHQSFTNSLHLVYPSLSPPFPHPTRLSPDARTILQCAFGPRCGRAALSESLPPNNAKEPGVSLTDSTRRILPPAPPHPFPWPASPNKHPPPAYPPRSIC